MSCFEMEFIAIDTDNCSDRRIHSNIDHLTERAPVLTPFFILEAVQEPCQVLQAPEVFLQQRLERVYRQAFHKRVRHFHPELFVEEADLLLHHSCQDRVIVVQLLLDDVGELQLTLVDHPRFFR